MDIKSTSTAGFIVASVLLIISATIFILGHIRNRPLLLRMEVARKQIEKTVQWSLGGFFVVLLMLNVAASAVTASKVQPPVEDPTGPPEQTVTVVDNTPEANTAKNEAKGEILRWLSQGKKVPGDVIGFVEAWISEAGSAAAVLETRALSTTLEEGFGYDKTSGCFAKKGEAMMKCFHDGYSLDMITLAEQLQFEHGRSTLSRQGPTAGARAEAELSEVLKDRVLSENKAAYHRIVVVGSHDVSGLDQENWRLAKERAELVRRLILELPTEAGRGYDPKSVIAVGSDNWILRESYLQQFVPRDQMTTDQERLNQDIIKGALGEYWVMVPDGKKYREMIDRPTKLMTDQVLSSAGAETLSHDELKAFRWLLEHDGQERAQRWYDGRLTCKPSSTRGGYDQPDCSAQEITDADKIRASTVTSKKRWAGFRTVVLIRLL